MPIIVGFGMLIHTKSRRTFLVKTDNQMFKQFDKPLLRVTPSFQMMLIGESVILTNLKKLEKPLHLDQILQNSTREQIKRIVENGYVQDGEKLQEVCGSPSVCKKLRHAVLHGFVIGQSIPPSRLIAYAQRKHPKLPFHFSADETRFDIRNKAEAKRFIKLLDDDYLYSEVSQVDYDSKFKMIL